MAILSFDGRVNIAVRIVTEQYPEAKLLEADGTASKGPTTDPAQIDQLRVVFSNVNDSTVIIKSIGYGEFGKPVLIPEPWLEDVIIKWPIKMDLPKANELKEKAGYKQPYGAVTLRNPLGPKLGNPCFIFGGNPGQPYIFVDTVTGKVSTDNSSDENAMPQAIFGGWSAWSFTIGKDAKGVFEKALAGFVGVGYTPLAFATQVVSGTNYCFLCKAMPVYPKATAFPALVYIHQLPTGDAHITNISEINP